MSRATYPRCVVALNVLFDDLFDGVQAQQVYVAIPRDVSVERNDHRTADTATIELDLSDLPIDPRSVVSISCEVYLGDVGEPDGELDLTDEDTLIFAGYVDEPSATWDDQGERIELKCRDFTAGLLDTKWQGNSIRIDRPLYAIIDEIVSASKTAEDVPVVFDPGANIILSKAVGRKWYKPRDKDDAWTLLVELCGLAGLVPVYDRRTLVIRAPENVRDTTVGLTYGVDVTRLKYSRQLRDRRKIQVEVRCWDDRARVTRTAKYPVHGVAVSKKVLTNGKVKTKDAPIVPFFVSGQYTEAQLSTLAKMLWDDAARDQLDGTVDTHEMVDADGVPIWQLSNGDQLQLRLERPGLTALDSMSDAEAMRWLTTGARAMAPEAAQALITAHRSAEDLATSWYVRRVHHKWSRDQGYEASIDFSAFVGA